MLISVSLLHSELLKLYSHRVTCAWKKFGNQLLFLCKPLLKMWDMFLLYSLQYKVNSCYFNCTPPSLTSHLLCLNVPIWLIHHGLHDITFIAVQRASQGQFGAVEITSITPSLSNKISSLGKRPHSNCTVIFWVTLTKANRGRGWMEWERERHQIQDVNDWLPSCHLGQDSN